MSPRAKPLTFAALRQAIRSVPTDSVRTEEEIEVIDQAIQETGATKVFALFSGGHDSVCSTYLAAQHPAFAGVIHCNTGIGIEETRVYVRETCNRFSWTLYEYHARTRNGQSIYDDMALAKGMPGGIQAHSSQYHILKEESIERAIRDLRGDDPLVILVTGIRRDESPRRRRNSISRPLRIEAAKYRAWVTPILDWSKLDVNHFMADNSIPRNEVVDKLHRSGECLCGALAHPDELKEIAFWYPDVADRIYSLEKACFDKGLPWRWGGAQRLDRPAKGQIAMPLCQSCETKWEILEASALQQQAQKPPEPLS